MPKIEFGCNCWPTHRILQQQAKLDAFVEEFHNERPHKALAMQGPAESYTTSPSPYQGIQSVLPVPRQDGVDDEIWLVTFMNYD